jgi:hypothetical protein
VERVFINCLNIGHCVWLVFGNSFFVLLFLLYFFGGIDIFFGKGSAHVRDLTLKCHFAHHLFGLMTDWFSEYHGLVPVKQLEGLFSPHPFFTFLVYFMWTTDKRRDTAKEDLELKQL